MKRLDKARIEALFEQLDDAIYDYGNDKFDDGYVNPACGVVKMTDTDDGSVAYLICGLPGGTPQFQFDISSSLATSVTNAPTCDNLKALKAFAESRFS